MAQNSYGERVVKICFPYDLDMIMKIRTLPGRKYHADVKCWSTPISVSSINSLVEWEFSIDDRLKTFIDKIKVREEQIVINGITGLNGILYPFQNKGVAFIETNNGRALIADEMGLGKTIQALAWLQLHPDKRPVIVVVPASVKLNWKREAEKWLPNPNVEVLSGETPWKPTGNIIVINYDILLSWLDALKKMKPQVLITDECFPAGTKITTPIGLKNIEELREGDLVFNAIGIGKVEKINKRSVNNLIRLHLNTQTYIDVTPNHLFFTANGWIPASKLINKKLLDYSNIFDIFAPIININQNEKNRKNLPMVWKTIPFNISKRISRSTILRKILFSEMEEYFTRNTNCIKISRKRKEDKCFSDNSTCFQSRLGKKSVQFNEKEQPINQSGNNEKDQSILERAWAPIETPTTSRRKWKTSSKSTTNPMGCIGSRMENRIPNQYKTKKEFWISIMLQSGYSSSEIQNLDRIGWLDSFIRKITTDRQKEGTISNDVRVDRIEILKSKCGEIPFQSAVYNLQISKHPSYYAEGFLVHNCHYYKSNKAFRTKAIKKLGKGVPHIIALSGTPIVNRPIEAYNAIQLINPDIFPNFFSFTHTYCNAKHTGFGWDFNGHSNDEELHKKLTGTIMIRRLKKDVLPDLPEKTRSFIPIELDNEREYDAAENNFITYIKQTKGVAAAEKASNAEVLAKIEVLKQLAVKGKLNDAISWIQDFLEVDGKLIVFATHKFVIDDLMNEFEKVAVKIDGSVSQIERQRAVDSFQNNDRIRLFVGNIQAAGVGITLTAASNVAFLELPWTPGSVSQAEDRCHRIGQRDSVNIYYLLAINTIEEKIGKLIDSKRKVLDAVLDGKETETTSLLSELIKQYEQ